MEHRIREKLVLTLDELKETAKRMDDNEIHSLDFETTGLDITKDEVVGLSIALPDGFNKYIPFIHEGLKCLSGLKIMEIIQRPIVESDSIIIAHNWKFDIQFFWNFGVKPDWKFKDRKAFCTQIAHYLLNENTYRHKLKAIAPKILGVEMKEFGEVAKEGRFYKADLGEALDYALKDTRVLIPLYNKFLPQLKKEKLDDVFWKMEMPYCRVLAKKERRGIDVDKKLLEDYKWRMKKELPVLESEIHEEAGCKVNPRSPQQLVEVLFSKNGFEAPVQQKTDTGNPSTNKESLKQLENINGPWVEFVKALRKYKKIQKVNSTYVEGQYDLIKESGKVHTNFNQTVTVTGRLSSSNPNLQNQPANPIWEDKYYIGRRYDSKNLFSADTGDKKSVIIPDDIKGIRELFPKHNLKENEKEGGYKFEDDKGKYIIVKIHLRDIYFNPNGILIVVDYSQVEMRIMTHFSKDEKMMEAIRNGEDIHTWVASNAYKVPMNEVTKDMRRRAKSVGFGTIYGKTPYGFAQDWYGGEPDFLVTKIIRGTPKQVINQKYINRANEFLEERFFGKFPGIKEYMEDIERYCRKYGYIRTLFGRKRRLPWIWSEDEWQQRRAKRQGVNAKIQGSAGGLIKLAQIKLEDFLEDKPITQVLQVHDEVVFYSPDIETTEKYLPEIKGIMENVVKLRVPITVDVDIVERWGFAK